jgi:hypothetical protein
LKWLRPARVAPIDDELSSRNGFFFLQPAAKATKTTIINLTSFIWAFVFVYYSDDVMAELIGWNSEIRELN